MEVGVGGLQDLGAIMRQGDKESRILSSPHSSIEPDGYYDE